MMVMGTLPKGIWRMKVIGKKASDLVRAFRSSAMNHFTGVAGLRAKLMAREYFMHPVVYSILVSGKMGCKTAGEHLL